MKKLLIILMSIIALTSCEKKDSQTSLRFDWVANMNFIGDIYASKDIAQKNGLVLKCEEAGFGVDPIKMVISNQSEFGIVSLEQLYMANEKGADLVAIGVINDVSPVVFLSKSDTSFAKPSDFENKTVGLNPGGATEYVYRAFVNENNLDKSKIKEIPVDYDIKSFINGNYDVRLAFAYIEPLDLEIANIKYTQMAPIDFGLKFPGRVYFTKKETIKNNPELVQKFVNTVAEGWEMALANKSKSIDYLVEFEPKINRERETKSLEIGKSYFTGFNNKVLSFDSESILTSANKLVEMGIIKKADFASMLDTSFINEYHK